MTAMAVVEGVDRLEPALGRLFVVVGVFDGLHLGHQYLLGELVRGAARLGARPTVLTFDHHPDEVITGTAPPLLLDPAERLDRLEAAGIAVTIVQHFDEALRRTPYDDFVRRIAGRVDLAGFLMTPESAFGFERRGTPETVAALGTELGYEVVVTPPFTLDGAAVTSSGVRSAIRAGDLGRAARLLGRPYAVTGTVVEAGAGERDAAGASRVLLHFPAPVALPTRGTFDATVQLDGATDSLAAAAEVAGGRLMLQTTPFAGRARVTFGPT